MNPRLKVVSIMLLVALALATVPAAAKPTPVFAAACYHAQFLADVTVPDGMSFQPGATFKKTWRLKNIGDCSWNNGVSLIFDSGSQLGAPASVALPSVVPSGQSVEVSVDMTAPNTAGRYRGYWKLKAPDGGGFVFGIGASANRPFWVEIVVTGGTTEGAALDFTARAGEATWSTGAGGFTFPAADGDAKGFALKKDKPKFESGVEASQPGLLFGPQQITNGFVQARYPAFRVERGDRFKTTVGCEFGATSCYVAYRLDYEIGNIVRTFWTFRERYEGWTYNANLDLSALAGQDVRFVLYMSAYGSPIGDRALWGSPIIARQGVVITPTVTGTPPTPTPTGTGTVPPSGCDRAQFIRDVTIPDGTVMNPGATFTKTWRLKNVGTCAWTTAYQLVYSSGEQMGAPASSAFTKNVAVGETVDISVNMTAPSAGGSYRGFWKFKNASGAVFGFGPRADQAWWVDIRVSGPTVTPGGPTNTPTPTVTPGGPTVTPIPGAAYDFATNACAGTWFSGAGQLQCPGADGDAKGFVLKTSNPKLENGTTDTRPGILTHPQIIQDGYIQGFFPAFRVQNGDRFRSIINCEGGARNCYVAFRLDYESSPGRVSTFWGPFRERYEGQFYQVDVDLSTLAGRDVKFVLTVLAAGTASGDRALWVAPHIYRASSGSATATPTPTATGTTTVATATPTPTGTTTSATATPTPTSTTAAATTYQNAKYNFKFTLPAGATIASQSDNVGTVKLPFTPGTNLLEKYIQVNVVENANPCVNPVMENPTASENVNINNIAFVKQSGQGVAAGNIYDWTAYATTRNNACISLAFILHSANLGNYATPPPAFNKEAESAVIQTVISTFNWINP